MDEAWAGHLKRDGAITPCTDDPWVRPRCLRGRAGSEGKHPRSDYPAVRPRCRRSRYRHEVTCPHRWGVADHRFPRRTRRDQVTRHFLLPPSQQCFCPYDSGPSTSVRPRRHLPWRRQCYGRPSLGLPRRWGPCTIGSVETGSRPPALVRQRLPATSLPYRWVGASSGAGRGGKV